MHRICRTLNAFVDLTMMLQQTKDHESLEASHDARLAVAGAASAAVQFMNDNERKGFEESCSQRRQAVLSEYAWEFRNLLCVQQTILSKLGVPGFDEPTVNAHTLEFQSNVCSLLHTAFFLRKNLGEERHNKMLESQRDRLEKDRNSRSPVPGGRSPPGSPVPPGGLPPRVMSPIPPGGMPPSYGGFGVPPPPLYGYPPNHRGPPPPPPGHYGGPPPPYYQQ
jgi:hypothetical protein